MKKKKLTLSLQLRMLVEEGFLSEEGLNKASLITFSPNNIEGAT